MISHRNPLVFFLGGGAIFCCFVGVFPYRKSVVVLRTISVILLAVSHRAGPRFKPGTDQAVGKRATPTSSYISHATPLSLIYETPLLTV
jgi:hypothetical protein